MSEIKFNYKKIIYLMAYFRRLFNAIAIFVKNNSDTA